MKENFRLGILGGMGPKATVQFYNLFLENTPADTDQDHIETIIAVLPKIPDRTQAILGKGEDPSSQILEGLNLLAESNVSLAVITCNTAHYFLKKIENLSPVPVLNMIEVVANALQNSKVSQVGLLATDGTISTNLYDQYLSLRNIEVVNPENKFQEKVMKLIYGKKGIKAGFLGEDNMNLLDECVNHLLSKGCKKVILGCTELSLLYEKRMDKDTLVDPFNLVVQEILSIIKKY